LDTYSEQDLLEKVISIQDKWIDEKFKAYKKQVKVAEKLSDETKTTLNNLILSSELADKWSISNIYTAEMHKRDLAFLTDADKDYLASFDIDSIDVIAKLKQMRSAIMKVNIFFCFLI
jgi:hypothetical protein